MGVFLKFWDDFCEKADRRAQARSERDVEDLLLFFEGCDVEGLDDVLLGVNELVESGLYKKLMDAYRSESEKKPDRVFEVDELKQVRVLGLARENLYFGGVLTNITHKFPLVTAKHFIMVHVMIKYVYVIFSGRNTNWDDELNVYFSGLDERIIFGLEDFDRIDLDDLPEPMPEYFKQLKKAKWADNESKQLYDKLIEFTNEIKHLVLGYPDLDEIVGWISTYAIMEDFYIQTLAACSAVNSGRLGVTGEDVVVAYKTFFKLLNTDVTQYKAIPERMGGIDNQGILLESGYLVCDQCNSYYELQKGESPDDYSDTCECGGKLKYKKEIEL